MASAMMSSISCGGDVLLGHHRVAELIVLVVELDDRARQLRALLDAEALRQRAGGDVAHDHFQRNDLHLADQLLAHVEAPDEVGRNPDIVEVLEDVFGDPVVEDAFAFDDLVLLRIEGGRVVLEVLDQRSGLRPFVQDLRLAFINAATAAHRSVPWFVDVHLDAVAPVRCDVRGGGGGATKSTNMRRVHAAKLADHAAQHNRRRNCFVTRGKDGESPRRRLP
jgi:hypothetical protein